MVTVLLAAVHVVGWLTATAPPANEAEVEQAILDAIAAEVVTLRDQAAIVAAPEPHTPVGVPSPASPPPPAPEPQPEPEPAPKPPPAVRDVWERLAECESGLWVDSGASFVEGSARWDWGAPGMTIPPWGTNLHHGGYQFLPSTYSAYRPDGYPEYAYDATPEQQTVVAKRVLAEQGVRAWPTCGPKVGLRPEHAR
jgi:hypothetical protein